MQHNELAGATYLVRDLEGQKIEDETETRRIIETLEEALAK